MTQGQSTAIESVESECEFLCEQHPEQTPIDHILQRLSRIELPAKHGIGVKSLSLTLSNFLLRRTSSPPTMPPFFLEK